MEDLRNTNLELQRVILQLVESNNNLVKKIDTLISLFEEAAKNISSGNSEEVFNLKSKINELVEQNKQLARGLLLMEERLKQTSVQPRPLPKL